MATSVRSAVPIETEATNMKIIFIYTGIDFGHNAYATDDIESCWKSYCETALSGSATDGGALPTQELHNEFVACFRPLDPRDPDDIKLALENGIINAAQAMRMKPSEKRSEQSRLNGQRGGRPAKTQPTPRGADGEESGAK